MVCIALNELAEGLGVRAVARTHNGEPETVLAWLRKAGEHCARLSECMMQDLRLSQVQLDELWTFVRKKERVLGEGEKLHTESIPFPGVFFLAPASARVVVRLMS